MTFSSFLWHEGNFPMDVRGEEGSWSGGWEEGARLPGYPMLWRHLAVSQRHGVCRNIQLSLGVANSCFFCFCLSVFPSCCPSFVLSSLSLPSFPIPFFFSTQLEYKHLRHENNHSSPNRVTCLVAQSCLTLCDHMDCNPPGSST